VSRFTVLGGSGFVGKYLIQYLKNNGHEVLAPSRAELNSLPHDLGHVVYAVGLTGDFRQKQVETIDAHVNVLASILYKNTFSSFLYLSSVRLYSGVDSPQPVTEEMALVVKPGLDAVYDLSKLLGESLCLMLDNPSVRVARLSNVYGHGQSKHTFLQMLLNEISEKGTVEIREAPQSAKDYVFVGDVVCALENIALYGQHRIYNVASGVRVMHKQIADYLASQGDAKITFAENGALRRFPEVSVERLVREFGWAPQSFLRSLNDLV